MTRPASLEKEGMADTRTLDVLLERSGNSGSTTFFEVPGEVMAELGSRKRLPLAVRINGASYRTTAAVYDGRFYVPVRAEIRAAAGVTPGQRVRVEVSRDDAPRTVDLPADLLAALEAAGLRDAFSRFAYSHQKEYVQAIEAAKRPETRAARIEKTLAAVVQKFGAPIPGGAASTETAKTPARAPRRTS